MRLTAFVVFSLLFSLPSYAYQCLDSTIALVADVSGSMFPSEEEVQRRGYKEVLQSDDVYNRLISGACQAIGLVYIEYASKPTTKVEWAIIRAREDFEDFGNKVYATETSASEIVEKDTGIGNAIMLAHQETQKFLAANPDIEVLKRVIDVSGDGINSIGLAPDKVIEQINPDGLYYQINGLPMLIRPSSNNLKDYYMDNIVSRTGFMVPVNGWEDFVPAFTRKLIQEMG